MKGHIWGQKETSHEKVGKKEMRGTGGLSMHSLMGKAATSYKG